MTTRLSLFLSSLIIGATGLYVATIYSRLPATIPTHWNINGVADGFAPKATGVSFGLILLGGIWLLMLALPWLSPKKFEIDTFRPTYNYITVIMVAMVAFINIVTVIQAFGGHDMPKMLIGGLMLFLAAMGNLLGKVRRNFFVGVRTPWTIASESNWVATHRLAARLMVAAGVIGAVLVFAGVPVMPVFVLFMAAILYPVLYSFLLYKRTEGNGKGTAVALLLIFAFAAHANADPVSRDVEFDGAGFKLKGTLLLPDKQGKFPAVLLLPGSGPTDRNGNQPGVTTDILKQIAQELAKNGIASFRFDKRAVASTYFASYPKDISLANDFLSWENQVADAKKALAYLQAVPQVDRNRVAVLGHSEGSMTAMEIGGTTSGAAATILVSAPGRTLAQVLRKQLEDGYARRPDPKVDMKAVLADYDRTIKVLDETGKITVKAPELQIYFPAYAPRYMRSFLLFDPKAVAPKIGGPVLVVQGQKDIQILASQDTPILLAALKTRKGDALDSYIVPGASHCLKAVQNENVEPGFEGPVIPSALNQIVTWLKKTLK